VIADFTRRDPPACSAAMLGGRQLQAAKAHITKSRSNVPESKKEFAFLTEPELKRCAAELAANRLKVSLLKTSLLKFSWETDNPRWDHRKDDLGRAITAAQILGVDKIRVFTGARAADPATAYPKIARTMADLTPLAESAGVRLLTENEPSQNIGTCAELKAILDLLPAKSIGFNWDPQNALSLGETAWPGLADSPDHIDWRALLESMERDGYPGQISVATEVFDGTFDKANDSVREVMHIVGELA
jgi:xylose isomerase-like TIM barrel protein